MNVAERIEELRRQVARAVIGQDAVVEEILICLLAGGHAREFRFEAGPIFGNLVLADEINRATPKTQSALLEAMQESAVTVSGTRHELEQPFLVLATQNPIEMEGTYPLPEAQLDRFFFKVLITEPGEDDLVAIVGATTGADKEQPEAVLDAETILAMRREVRAVSVAEPLVRHIARLVRATQPDAPEAAPAVRQYIRYGAGVRAAQSLVLAAKAWALLAGRTHVAFADLRRAFLPALRHRVVLNFEGEAAGVATDDVLVQVLDHVPQLPEDVARLAPQPDGKLG
jgi:MoxR-like ATPase